MKGTIVVPAYNEFFRMSLLFPRYYELTKQYEMILVDDGSNDQTYRIGELLGWHIVRLPRNMGKGFAVRVGVLKALSLKPAPEFIGFTDADLSVSPDQWGKLIEKLKDFDIVIGSRSMPDSIVHRNSVRKLASKVFSTIVDEVLQLQIHDTQCGLKFFRPEVAKLLFTEPLIANRFAFDVEILLRAKMLDFSIAEIGVNWQEQKGSHVKLRTTFEMIKSLIKLANAYNGLSPLEYKKIIQSRRVM
ncbi:glycosyl transferase family 2 [Caldicellulosiruptor kronotskyensis 2002]|uniref:dolichyl-phosphate beta-glucosyltransferase n=1 Tax=Caldicellulosiruptor kronotskyensis (strain DSM 18902 / VKM B-2412 / 2002) TaxID=632348 RepID=E4SES7_CALK2|nr:dolichyl-phosphate beta-glucosyltransferase [Caldicellulosiruptor kronotskyensis]ADQ45564.1 glycosyl transferase family 2 [Caldicellulosiruptor kronotskyensis 2002]